MENVLNLLNYYLLGFYPARMTGKLHSSFFGLGWFFILFVRLVRCCAATTNNNWVSFIVTMFLLRRMVGTDDGNNKD